MYAAAVDFDALRRPERARTNHRAIEVEPDAPDARTRGEIPVVGRCGDGDIADIRRRVDRSRQRDGCLDDDVADIDGKSEGDARGNAHDPLLTALLASPLTDRGRKPATRHAVLEPGRRPARGDARAVSRLEKNLNRQLRSVRVLDDEAPYPHTHVKLRDAASVALLEVGGSAATP